MGVHTCDERHNRTWIATHNPSWTFEEGFAEQDELWDADVRETPEAQQARIHDALVKIINNDPSTCPYTCLSRFSALTLCRYLCYRA
jgi:hypothetical protein